MVCHVVSPMARSYRPQLILVSAGFDAHRDDPLANCLLTEDSYAALAAAVRTLALELDAPFGFVLEGGYDLRALAASVASMLRAATSDGGQGNDDLAVQPLAAEARGHYARWWPELSG